MVINIFVNYFIFIGPISFLISYTFLYIYWLSLFFLLYSILISKYNKKFMVHTLDNYLPNTTITQVLINLLFFLPKNSAFISLFFIIFFLKNTKNAKLDKYLLKNIITFLVNFTKILFILKFLGVPGIIYFAVKKSIINDFKVNFYYKVFDLFNNINRIQKFENTPKIIVLNKINIYYKNL